VILQTTRDAADAATVMPALGRLAWDLRALLGERPPDDPRELEQTGMSLSLEADHEYSVGHDLSASGQRAAAVAHLERAVALDPRLARAHSALGAALDTLGRYAEAEKELRLALAGDGLGPWERAMFSGLYQSQIGDYDRAIDSYTEALRRRPGDVGTEINLGIQTNYARRAARAVEIGRRAVAGHPTHLYARTDLARWLLSAGDVDAAQREAATVIQRFPHPLSVNYVTAAAAAALAGRRSEALDALAKLRAVDRSAADADLADLALAEGRLDDAASILEAAIAADKTEHDVDGTAEKRALLAETYLRRGDAKRALAAARLAIARGSRSTILIAGEVAIDAGSTPDEALAALARQDAQEPRAYAKILAAHALRSGGDPRAALAAYDEAERILPTWTGRFGAARASLALRSYAEAERALHGCVALDGGVSNVFPAGNTSSLRYRTLALHELARALDAANDASARSAYEAFLAHEPDAQHDPLAADARRRVTSRSP
jgi:tetratricopeptide (TPR) repeat protein